MPQPRTATQTLDREFLDIRSRILDIAAALDRIDRADGSNATTTDARLVALRQGIALLIDDKADRARRLQMVFSDDYDPAWR